MDYGREVRKKSATFDMSGPGGRFKTSVATTDARRRVKCDIAASPECQSEKLIRKPRPWLKAFS